MGERTGVGNEAFLRGHWKAIESIVVTIKVHRESWSWHDAFFHSSCNNSLHFEYLVKLVPITSMSNVDFREGPGPVQTEQTTLPKESLVVLWSLGEAFQDCTL